MLSRKQWCQTYLQFSLESEANAEYAQVTDKEMAKFATAWSKCVAMCCCYATAATAAPRTSAPPLANPLTSPLSRRHQVRPAESMKEAHQIVRGMSLRVVDGHQLHFDEVFVALCKYVALLPLVYYASDC